MYLAGATTINGFSTVYDAQMVGGIAPSAPEELQPALLGFGFALVTLVIFLFVYKKWNPNIRLLGLPLGLMVFSSYFIVDFWDRVEADKTLASGKITSIQGCIKYFETNHGESHSSRNSSPDEEWYLGGNEFAYKNWTNRPGYHRMEARGGVVHNGQYLRVSYLVTPIFHRKEIMKIEVGAEQCPRSPA